jgi:replicative DNA helicase
MTALASINTEPMANVEGEYHLVATLLYESKRVDVVADILSPDDFSEPFLGRLYDLIVTQYSKGNPLSALTLRPYIEADPGYIALGGTDFLVKITNASALAINALNTARQIADLARRRRLLGGLKDALEVGNDLSQDVPAVIDIADAALVEASDKASDIHQPTGAAAMGELLKSIEQPSRSVRCGNIPSIDELLGGIRAKQLVIAAGRPGMGKTAVALSYTLGAVKNGFGVLFVSLEMSAKEIAARMAADIGYQTGLLASYADINSDAPSRKAIKAITDAKVMLDDAPLQFVDAGSLQLGRLDRLVRRYKRRFAAKGQSLDLIVIDYMQLLRCDHKQASAYEAVSEISRRLKGIAKDHDVGVLALAQLSRAVEQRADKRPQLSDLRDSGQIEQDADAVMFFYRHAYYLRQALPRDECDPMYASAKAEMEACEASIEFIVEKRRNGVPGTKLGEFHGQYQAVRG